VGRETMQGRAEKKIMLNNYLYLGYFKITSQENRKVGEAPGIE
jgi:hypothetical protein